MLNPTLSRKF